MRSSSVVFSRGALATAFLLVAGCAPSKPDARDESTSLAGTKIALVIVDDPPLAEAIGRLHGQWRAETGGDIAIENVAPEDLTARLADDAQPADAVIYAPRLLGPLVGEGRVRALTAAELATPELDWADLFALVKTREVTWGSDVMGVPLGAPVLVCFYREDLLAKLGQKPPRTWQEYQALAALLAQSPPTADSKAWQGTVEPLAPGWCGLTLLARGAAYARHPNHYSTLFNMQTMEPLVASAPFVRALTELVDAAKLAPGGAPRRTPGEAWQAITGGQAGMALCWPAQRAEAGAPVADLPEIGCAELPGAVEVFNATTGGWEQRAGGATLVPLLGLAGRVGSIMKGASQPAAALRLLAWLSSKKWSERIVAGDGASGLFRASQVAAPQAWAGGLRTGEAQQYAQSVAGSLGAADCLIAPRIPGATRYLAALDQAVEQALAGTEPAVALQGAADAWRAITAELGLEAQRAAYSRSLGLDL